MFGITPYRREGRPLRRMSPITEARGLLEDFFNDSFLPAFTTSENFIRTDIRETDKAFLIEADIPGFKKEEIKIDLAENQLRISAEKAEQVEEEKDNYIRKERRYGSFSRSFYLENVDTKNVKAKYEDGVLSVVLPKKEPEMPDKKSIEIE